MAARCEECGEEVDMPFDCKFCQGRYCDKHRLPEKHDCRGLVTHKEQLRQEGRLLQSPGKTVERSPGAGGGDGGLGARVDAALAPAWRFLEGRAALTFLGIMVAVFFLEQVALSVSDDLFETLFVLGPAFYWKPWTLVTSVFAHAPGFLGHILANGIVLFFFGPALERLVGTRRFVKLFLGAGVAAGLVQVSVFAYLLPLAGFAPSHAGVLGASGAIMGVLGALTILAPETRVLLFFFIPAPLWLVTAGYALYDLGGALLGVGNTAHLAHLAGLAIGLYVGRTLRDEGLALQVQAGGPGGGLGGAGGGGGLGGGGQGGVGLRYRR